MYQRNLHRPLINLSEPIRKNVPHSHHPDGVLECNVRDGSERTNIAKQVERNFAIRCLKREKHLSKDSQFYPLHYKLC